MLQIFVSFTFLIILTDVVRCKPDYIFNNKVDGWLKLHRIPATWEEALLKCHYEGAVLASPLDKHLENALKTLVSESKLDRDIFLGTNDLFSEGDFFSVEGVPLYDMSIKLDLVEGEAGLEHCVTMHVAGFSYYTYTSPCSKRLPYICYKKLENETLNECGTYDNKYHLDYRTGSCYKLHRDQQTWSRAHMICAAEGGYLVILNDNAEARIVKDMFPTDVVYLNLWEPMHIGLRAWTEDRTWLTIHGEGLEDVFHSWIPTQPYNRGGKQYCGSFIRNGTLDVAFCDSKAIFVCEKDPNTDSRFEPVVIETTENQEAVTETTENQEAVTETTKNQEAMTETTENQEAVTGTTENQEEVTETTENQEAVTGTTENQEAVTGTTENQEAVTETTENQEETGWSDFY